MIIFPAGQGKEGGMSMPLSAFYSLTDFMKICFIIAILLLPACKPAVLVTSSKVSDLVKQGKKYSYVFITVMTENTNAKKILETDLANKIGKEGVRVIKSCDVFSGALSGAALSSKAIIEKIEELGCDAIFTVVVLRKETELRHVPGEAYNTYTAYSQYGTFGGYYGNWNNPVHAPGYYVAGKTYYLESDLFDVVSQGLLWSVQSQVYQPENIFSFSKKYTNAVVSRLKKDKLLKRKH